MSLECSFYGLFLWVKFSFHVTSVAFWMAICYNYLICIEITWNTQYVGCTFVWRFILVWLRPLGSNECYSTWWYHLWEPLSQQFVFVPHDNALVHRNHSIKTFSQFGVEERTGIMRALTSTPSQHLWDDLAWTLPIRVDVLLAAGWQITYLIRLHLQKRLKLVLKWSQ